MAKQIKDSVLKSELIEWKKLDFIQHNDFKHSTEDRLEKLKSSIKKHGFMMPFFIWEDKKGVLWCVDGFHRDKGLHQLIDEGYAVPDKLPGVFIDCKNKKDAAERLLSYSSSYANVSDEGLYKFTHDFGLDYKIYKPNIDLPNFSMKFFEYGYIDDKPISERQESADHSSDNSGKQTDSGEDDSRVKQLVMYFDNEEYAEVVLKLNKLMEKEGLDGFADCIKHLLKIK